MRGRGPVVHLDRAGKARMIEAILCDFRGSSIEGLTTLDIGCGNGGISSHFAASNDHFAVDVVDQRKIFTPEYTFKTISNELLPFEDGIFDIVISNHVIEHVTDQRRHLLEIRRVLRTGGCVYLATPNKSSPIMEGHVGNDNVLRYHEMGPLIRSCGFQVVEYGVSVAQDPQRYHGEVRWARVLPSAILKLLRPLFPSHIFVLTEPGGSLADEDPS